jgi:TonB family protein
VYYAEDGTVTHRAVFENGKLMSGNIPVEKDMSKYYSVVEVMPQFPGGESELFQHLSKNIRYPASAFERKVTGKVVVRFVIETDGSVGRVEVLRSVDVDLDTEAVRVIQSLPNWTPGMQGGIIVPVSYTLPINFGFNEGSNFNNRSSIQNNDLPQRNNGFNRTFPTRRF